MYGDKNYTALLRSSFGAGLFLTFATSAQFSALFKQLAVSRYGAVAAKVRRAGIGNPISSLRHVKLV